MPKTVSYDRLRVLHFLAKKPEKWYTAKQVANYMRIPMGSAESQLEALVKDKMIEAQDD
jgi:predicted transcriptional regulator